MIQIYFIFCSQAPLTTESKATELNILRQIANISGAHLLIRAQFSELRLTRDRAVSHLHMLNDVITEITAPITMIGESFDMLNSQIDTLLATHVNTPFVIDNQATNMTSPLHNAAAIRTPVAPKKTTSHGKRRHEVSNSTQAPTAQRIIDLSSKKPIKFKRAEGEKYGSFANSLEKGRRHKDSVRSTDKKPHVTTPIKEEKVEEVVKSPNLHTVTTTKSRSTGKTNYFLFFYLDSNTIVLFCRVPAYSICNL